MTTVVSFSEFLRTGRLGLLHTGMTPGDVASLEVCVRAAEANACLDSIYAFPASPIATGGHAAEPRVPTRQANSPVTSRKIALICAPHVYFDILGSDA